MSPLPDLLNLPITVDTLNYNDAVLEILTKIKPQWKAPITVKRIDQGFVNQLLLCWGSDGEDDDKVMVRVFGDNRGLDQCFNRDSEIEVMRVLAHEKLISPVYCRCRNGVVYGYAPGSTFDRAALKDKAMQRLICSTMHRMHQVDLKGYLGEIQRPGLLVFTDRPWQVIREHDYTDVVEQDRYKEVLPPLDELQKNQAEVHAIYDDLCTKYPLVYTHADLHTHNMVYDQTTGSLCFVDWEGASFCPEIFDITILFDRQPSDEVSANEFSTEECRRELLETFLSSHSQHGQQPITKQLLDQWYSDSVRASVVSCFNIVSFCLACIKNSPKEADFLAFSIMFYKKFCRFKQEAQRLGTSQ